MTESPEQPRQPMLDLPAAIGGDPEVIAHPGEAPYAVRVEWQIMPRDWDRIQKLVLGNNTTAHRVLTSLLRIGLDYFYEEARCHP